MNGGRKSGRITEVERRGLRREEDRGGNRIPVGGGGGGGCTEKDGERGVKKKNPN